MKRDNVVTNGIYLRYIVCGLLFCVMVLPTGVFAGVPFKHLLYIGALAFLVAHWARGDIKIDSGLLLLFVGVLSFTFFFALIGILNDNTSPSLAIKEASGIFTAGSIYIIVIASVRSGVMSGKDVIYWSFFGSGAFALWKVSAALLLATKVLPFDAVYYFLVDQAGYRIVSSGIFGGFVRINLIICDFAVAFFLVLIIVGYKYLNFIPRWVQFAYLVLGGACVIFAFSRLLFVLVFFGLVWSFVFNMKFKERLFLVGLALLVLIASSDWLAGAVEQRFNSTSAVYSDLSRDIQIDALFDELNNAPLVGNGFGSYSKSVIRDPLVPYSYEVQWVGFLAKLGLIGTSILVSMMLWLFWQLLKTPIVNSDIALTVSLLAFVIGGFTNQYLASSASGVIYCLHILSKQLFHEKMDFNN